MPGTDSAFCSVRQIIQVFEALKCTSKEPVVTTEPMADIPRPFVIPIIVIDDFDSCKESNSKETRTCQLNGSQQYSTPIVYTQSYSDASIKKFLDEAEHRKHEFWKLLDEHNAVIENLKRIEKLERKII
ncbi:hypothetical protein GWI33_001165 [Rhynchophorus ferrugineus]|uniref:Uncharacterized protein n=1 Tax=Rhynchophorus ferrugineus TaxID=354439 RepID=A0A834MGJ4_RHYFE|nr:hypothetical protein GWI33_001165 [Rhynchophorus ferrugineus]